MIAVRSRLARLLDIRRVRLRIAARDLARAAANAAANAGMAARIDELRADMPVETGIASSYHVKSAAATRAALTAAIARQAIRVAEAEAYRAHFAGEVLRQRAAIDVVARAVDKAVSVESRS